MRVKVIKKFRDKYTGAIYSGGHPLELTHERAKEINAAKGGPYVEELEKKKQTVEKKKQTASKEANQEEKEMSKEG